MALKPENPVVGGTALRRQSIRSPNYAPGASGWTINQDGSAEFNNLTIRGTFAGTNFIINSAGAFFYSPSEAAGNLVASIAATAGVDAFGNNYVTGHASYAAGFAASLNAGFVQCYTGSLAGGWTAGASIQTDAFGDIFILASAGRSVTTNNNTLDDGAGHMTVTGLTVNGSTSTGVGDNGGVTSGPSGTVSSFPAAGPNHTHNETHHHPL